MKIFYRKNKPSNRLKKTASWKDFRAFSMLMYPVKLAREVVFPQINMATDPLWHLEP